MTKGRPALAQRAMCPLEGSLGSAQGGGSMEKVKKSTSYAADKRKLLARLKRIEGHVRGRAKMVDEDPYCVDILQQIASLRAAANGVAGVLLRDHLEGCVLPGTTTEARDQNIDEVIDVIRRYSHS